ncbi:IdgA domain protein [Cordyceps fumosorosea ARSEF 2679]|uniref:IdgA domain protein n=1 Tax=Cordyceps fumosorosea (strain ARSEF 2679) TaxID=1081104 RepID=A0A168E264_CORFA|nr:IdgA domain protein [Cordyceps fumosorosea ARSEF 2679]OAA73286.1 IdgA domain protein [Cordyceps fumosorosea ARSEF 2679]
MSSDVESNHSDVEETKQKAASVFYEKDSDEEELERLVLGDTAGFRANLFKNDGKGSFGGLGEDVDMDAGTGDLEEVDDNDLFMMDTTTAKTKGPITSAPKVENDPNAPVWVDSDDDRLAISLAGTTRLRKLRLTEAEDLVSGTEYCRRLRQQYLRLTPAPAWAKEAEGRPSKRRRSSAGAADSDSSNSDGDDDDDAFFAQPLEKFLRSAGRLGGAGGPRRLRPEVIDIQRTREIPDKHKAPVASLSFHPQYPVLLSASSASILHLHHIAPDAQPTPNPRLTSVQARRVDVRRAAFLYPDGDKIVFGGRRRYFHTWDLPSGAVSKTTRVLGHHKLEHRTMERFRLSPCGRYMAVAGSSRKGGGVVDVLSVATTQWIAGARLTGRHGVADFAWWGTGDGLSILGRDGQVGEYSVEARAFVGVWHDEGCVGGIVIALGGHQGPAALGDDRWVAVGSNSGITNIYDRSALLAAAKADDGSVSIKERPTPTRTFEQLVTPVTELAFSPDGQLFAFASQHKKDALRLVHLPTCTVYRNWPTEQTNIGRVTAVAFGRQSNLLAVGNDTGKIRLWDIRS